MFPYTTQKKIFLIRLTVALLISEVQTIHWFENHSSNNGRFLCVCKTLGFETLKYRNKSYLNVTNNE